MRIGPDISNWQGEISLDVTGKHLRTVEPFPRVTNMRVAARYNNPLEHPQNATPASEGMPSVLAADISSDILCWKNHGADVAIVRASLETEGKRQLAQRQMDAVLRGGADLSVYGWVYWDWTPAETARAISDLVGDRPCRWLWWDVEDEDQFPGADAAKEWMRAAFIEAEISGFNTGTYTGEWFIDRFFGGDAGHMAHRPLWSAHYTGAPFEHIHPYGGWSLDDTLVHQFSSTYQLCGRVLDMNGFADRYFEYQPKNAIGGPIILDDHQRIDQLEGYVYRSHHPWLEDLHRMTYDEHRHQIEELQAQIDELRGRLNP